MAGDEVCVVGVAGPGADVDDVEGLVDQVADGDELVENEKGCGRCGGEVEAIGCCAAWWGECWQAEVDVLRYYQSAYDVVKTGNRWSSSKLL